MMLCKLALKNIRKSIKDYTIYFFTIMLGVAIFYVFNAIESQTIMLDISKDTRKIVRTMTTSLAGLSVFISFILGFLIIYASRFLMKKRNREFGIYMTLGMSKGKISMILFTETLAIGILSLTAGLAAGVVLSQFMSILVSNMFEADMKKFEFVFSSDACLKSLICFGVMYLIVMIFNTLSIGRCKLIDLIRSNKKSEKIKLKNPLLCVILFVAASAMLGYAYWFVTSGTDRIKEAGQILIPITLGGISTFLIFFSLSGLILKIVMSVKNVYYRGLNSFILRQLSSKVNTAVFSMTVICLLLFFTICLLSGGLSIKNSMSANLNKLVPADLQLMQRVNLDETDEGDIYTKEQVENSNLTAPEVLDKLDFDLKSDLKDIISISIYRIPELTFHDTLGASFEQIKDDNFKFMTYDSLEDFVKISDYNKLAKLFKKETYTLKSDEYMIIANYEQMSAIRNVALKNGEHLYVQGHDLTPKYPECKDGFIHMSSIPENTGIIIVPDEIMDEKYVCYNLTTANYRTDSKEEKLSMEEKLYNLNKSDSALKNRYIFPIVNSRLRIAGQSIGIGVMVTFIGLYLGIIFLISCAAVQALKELSESGDNRERYAILRKIGADERLINRALFRQIGIYFLFPLTLAVIHSIFGIKFCKLILDIFGKDGLLPAIIMTAAVIILIYGGYFVITYLCSKNIIKEN